MIYLKAAGFRRQRQTEAREEETQKSKGAGQKDG
jgi:hypothetical protein